MNFFKENMIYKVVVSALAIVILSGLLVRCTNGDYAAGPANMFLYVAGHVSNNIAGYTIDPASGSITMIPGSLISTGASPRDMVADPFGRFIYVASSTTVSVYSINPTSGILIPVSGSPFAGVTTGHGIAIDPTGRFLYVADGVPPPNNITQFDVSSSGALTATGSFSGSGGNMGKLVIDQTGQFLYTADGSGTTTGFIIDPNTGNLTNIGSFATGLGTNWITIDPTNRFVYASNNGANTISSFSINFPSGTLSATGSASVGGVFAVDPTGKFGYDLNAGANNILEYGINPATGAILSSFATISTGTFPDAYAIDPRGFLFVGDANSPNNISVYSINESSGVLIQNAASPFYVPTNTPEALAVAIVPVTPY